MVYACMHSEFLVMKALYFFSTSTSTHILNLQELRLSTSCSSKLERCLTFASAQDAATAISRLHDTELNGRLDLVSLKSLPAELGASAQHEIV